MTMVMTVVNVREGIYVRRGSTSNKIVQHYCVASCRMNGAESRKRVERNSTFAKKGRATIFCCCTGWLYKSQATLFRLKNVLIMQKI